MEHPDARPIGNPPGTNGRRGASVGLPRLLVRTGFEGRLSQYNYYWEIRPWNARGKSKLRT